MVTIEISLPDDLVEEAKRKGLLSTSAVEKLFRDAIQNKTQFTKEALAEIARQDEAELAKNKDLYKLIDQAELLKAYKEAQKSSANVDDTDN